MKHGQRDRWIKSVTPVNDAPVSLFVVCVTGLPSEFLYTSLKVSVLFFFFFYLYSCYFAMLGLFASAAFILEYQNFALAGKVGNCFELGCLCPARSLLFLHLRQQQFCRLVKFYTDCCLSLFSSIV